MMITLCVCLSIVLGLALAPSGAVLRPADCTWDENSLPPSSEYITDTECVDFEEAAIIWLGGNTLVNPRCACIVFTMFKGEFLPCADPCENYSASVIFWAGGQQERGAATSGLPDSFEVWDSDPEASCPELGYEVRLMTTCRCTDAEGQELCHEVEEAWSGKGDCVPGCPPRGHGFYLEGP